MRAVADVFQKLGTGQLGLGDLVSDELLDIDGSLPALLSFFRLLDPVDTNFAIVTP